MSSQGTLRSDAARNRERILAAASELFAESGADLSVDKIARRSGMGNGDRLAKIFRKRMMISPTEFRTQGRRAPGV